LHGRLNQAVADWNHYQQGEKETSVGMRLVFHGYAKSMFLSSPWIGYGTGGFSHFYQQINTAQAYSNIKEPHSQYWLIASEFGILGLITLVYFFTSLVISAFSLHEMKPVMLGLLACFFISNLSDSQLLHSDIGYLFIVFSALCLGELIENHQAHTVKPQEHHKHTLLRAII
jgi:O-antigen ligase